MGHRLSEKAMLARLSISQWSARKFDKGVTDEVHQAHGTTRDAGRYTKRLVAKDAIDAIAKTANAARAYHATHTLPWHDDGARILPAGEFMAYSTEMRKLRRDFDVAVSSFVANYPEYVESARHTLNGLFKETDYPKVSEIQSRYSFETSIDPLPDAADFRVELSDADLADVRAEIDARAQAAEATAMRDLWQRLHDAVAHAAERLSDPDAVFRNSLVENLRDVAALLPRLNLTNDPDLERARVAVLDKLCVHTPDVLRDNQLTRARTAQDAQAILDSMAGYMGKVS